MTSFPSYEPSDDDAAISPAAWLRKVVDALDEGYRRHWGQAFDPDTGTWKPRDGESEENTLFIQIGTALKSSAHSLTVYGRLAAAFRALDEEAGYPQAAADPVGFVRKVIRLRAADDGRYNSHPIVRDGLELSLAQDAIAKLSGAEGRLADLLDLVGRRKLSERAGSYIDRATHLYLWGFESETVVMCGAALEAAYPERFSQPDMVRLLRVPENRSEFASYEYESAARTAGVLSKEQRDLARQIRVARNDIVHTVPSVALKAKAALGGTVELLDRLFPSTT